MDTEHEAFLKRLDELQGGMKDAAFARKVGVPASTLKMYQKGSLPSIAIAARIAGACGVTVDWLAGLEAERRPSILRNARPRPRVDVGLMNELGKLVARVHQEEGIRLPSEAIAHEAAKLYNDLMVKVADPQDKEEIISLFPWLKNQLRKGLLAAKDEPGTGKQSA